MPSKKTGLYISTLIAKASNSLKVTKASSSNTVRVSNSNTVANVSKSVSAAVHSQGTNIDISVSLNPVADYNNIDVMSNKLYDRNGTVALLSYQYEDSVTQNEYIKFSNKVVKPEILALSERLMIGIRNTKLETLGSVEKLRFVVATKYADVAIMSESVRMVNTFKFKDSIAISDLLKPISVGVIFTDSIYATAFFSVEDFNNVQRDTPVISEKFVFSLTNKKSELIGVAEDFNLFISKVNIEAAFITDILRVRTNRYIDAGYIDPGYIDTQLVN